MRASGFFLLVLVACVGDSPAPAGPPDASQDSSPIVDSGGGDQAVVDSATPDAGADAAFVPPSGADLKLWLRADTGVATPFAWVDKSGNGNDAIALSDAGSTSPMYKGTYFPNGLPAFVFNGTTDILRLPDTPAFDDFTNGLTFFVVAMPLSATLGTWVNFSGISTTSRFGFGQSTVDFFLIAGSTTDPAGASNPPNEPHLYAATVDPSKNVAFYRDSTATGTGTAAIAPASAARSFNTVGGAQSSSGLTSTPAALGEILVYARALTPADRSKVEAYLKSRWATP